MKAAIPKGITNVGNTCYMGSFLQLLYNNRTFREDVLSLNLDVRHKMKMIEAMQKFFALLRFSQVRSHISPSQIKVQLPDFFRMGFQ